VKVVILCQSIPPSRESVGNYTYLLGKELLKLGLEVTVITSANQAREANNAKDIDFGEMRVLSCAEKWNLKAIPLILECLRKLSPNLVNIQYTPWSYGHQLGLMINILPWMIQKEIGIKVITTIHEHYLPWRYWKTQLHYLITQRLKAYAMIKASNRLIISTIQRKERLIQLSFADEEKIDLIYIPSNIPVCPISQNEIEVIRNNLGVKPDMTLLSAFGLRYADGIYDVLFNALAKVKQTGHKFKMVYLGNLQGLDKYMNKIKRLQAQYGLKKDIVWTGYLDAEDVSKHLSSSDMYLLPLVDGVSTRRGTLSVALDHALPTIATKRKNYDRIFVNRENIILVSLSDADEFASAICKLIEFPQLRRHIAVNGKKLHDKNMSRPIVARKTLEAYKKTISNSLLKNR